MALPADVSPPPAPNEPDQHDGTGRAVQPGRDDAAESSGQEPGSMAGLPRLFFADDPQHGTEQYRGRPYGQPPTPGQFLGQGQIPQPGSIPQSEQDQRAGFGPPAGWQSQGRAARPVRPRPTRPPERELRQRAIASLVLGALSLVALLGLGGDLSRGVYLLIFSSVIGVAACVIGITAVLKARRTGTFRPRGAVGGIVLGALAAVLSIPILATYLAFPRQVDNYVKCLSQAQTSGRQQSCMDRFYRQIHLGAGRGGADVKRGAGLQRSAGAQRGTDPRANAGDQGRAEGPPGRLGASSPASWSAHRSR